MKKLGVLLVLFALAFNIIETAYFGFNRKAMTRPEEVCDVISTLLFQAGFIIIILGYVKDKE